LIGDFHDIYALRENRAYRKSIMSSRGEGFGGGGKVKTGTLCKGGSYAQFTGEQIKIKWVIVARTVCSLYGSSAPVKVVRGGDGRCAPAFLCWRLHR
jgi:hypothetical protein